MQAREPALIYVANVIIFIVVIIIILGFKRNPYPATKHAWSLKTEI